MKKYIVDVFTFFAPTGRELLELRINVLKDYVDKFVICESNKTQSGISIEYELEKILDTLDVPREKIEIVQLNIPDDNDLELKDIDRSNCYHGNDQNINSVRARARERIQKDFINDIIDQFPDNAFFIVSDSDEIINPKYIDWFTDMVIVQPTMLVKIPLVHLEGCADLRVYYKDSNEPKMWDGGMFICTKHHLKLASASQMRSNVGNPFRIVYVHQSGARVEDAGWHFSWMGDEQKRKDKRKSFCHYSDSFSFILGGSYDSNEIETLLSSEPKEGNTSVSGEINTILKKYPHKNLPKEIFEIERVKKYLLPNYNESNIFQEEYLNACNTPTDINEHLPILYELALDCKSVTEMGVRSGESTRAFLFADVKLRSYDLELDNNVIDLFNLAKSHKKDVEYIQGDTRLIEIDETDLLFIDTWHCYEQLKIELIRHASKVKKYIAMHDTFTFGCRGESAEIGLLPALIEFMTENPNWKFKIHRINNNGLTVIERDN